MVGRVEAVYFPLPIFPWVRLKNRSSASSGRDWARGLGGQEEVGQIW